MDILVDYRWYFLIGAEIIFWISIIGFFALRYMFQLKKASFIAGIVLLINELFILTLAVIDYVETGTISQFQMVIALILLYAIIYGKKDLRKLDFFVQKRVAKQRGQEPPVMEEVVELTGWAYAKRELKQWGVHVLAFIGVHVFFFFTYGLIPISEWMEWGRIGIVKHEGASRISQIWGVIFVIDTIITWSYVIFPKKEKSYL
ncbi:hypothetical protein [Priestia taiwanensis]|uniref:Integral membrane protein n=1 Tax=Priestia taiwanensis TaxID=1347902 RepID=A0A917ES81_9BACI|nr:hypothetical protein [Priestia taiwanensis]MBM7364424.1 uncharacterized protein YneF (UPF0154 family) [Priestia taiwanensis]GGE81556.1 hypothetical protein GCM10007140_33950 [Priestia taiwanensis]